MSVSNQVFLSYAEDDLEIANNIYNGLTKRELNVWFDKKKKEPGKWKKKTEKAIANSRYFLFCMSNYALKREKKGEGFQCEEFDFAYNIAKDLPESKFTIIPIRLEDCGRGDLRMEVYDQYDLFMDFEGTLDNLAVKMGGLSLAYRNVVDERTEDEKLVAKLFGKAQVFFYAGNFKGCKSLLEAIIQVNPKEAIAWINLGVVLGKLGRLKDELANYNKAIKLKPDNAVAWSNRGNALGRMNRTKETIRSCERAIKLQPGLALAWYNQALALGKLGKHEEALISYSNALKFKPDYADAWYNKGVELSELGRHDEALSNYNEVVKLKPDYGDAWYNRGLALKEMGNLKESLKSLSKAIELNPNNASAYVNQGVLLGEMGRHDEALDSFKRAINLEPNLSEAWYNHGVTLKRIGRYEEANISLEMSKKIQQKNSKS